MTLDEALAYAFACDTKWADDAEQAAVILAAEVLHLQAEVTGLRIYAPARRPQPTVKPAPIAPTNFEYWGVVP